MSRSLQNFFGVFGQNAALGAGEVILRQFGDLLEKLRATLIVEEPRAERFRCASEARNCFVHNGFVQGVKSRCGHKVSLEHPSMLIADGVYDRYLTEGLRARTSFAPIPHEF